MRQFCLDPSKQALLWRLFLVAFAGLHIPIHGELLMRQGIVQNKRPDKAKDQLQVLVNNVGAVCKGKNKIQFFMINSPMFTILIPSSF